MSQRTLVVLDDDLDGGPADQTVTFSLDDVAYTIDLNDANAAALREALAVWVAHARKTARPTRAPGGGGGGGTAPRRPRGEPRADLTEVRAWGKENGFTVSERGRIGGDLQQAYDRAHADADTVTEHAAEHATEHATDADAAADAGASRVEDRPAAPQPGFSAS